MSGTTSQTKTAAQAYDETSAAITAALNHLANGLAKHKKEAHADPKNWGYVGDLNHVNDLLQRAARFINGEEE